MLRKGERAAKFYIGNVTIGSISISTKKKKKKIKKIKKTLEKPAGALIFIYVTFLLPLL